MSAASGAIAITSLFSDFRVDCINQAHLYDPNFNESEDSPYFYNAYSLPRLERFCLMRGALGFIAEEFEIDFDLPKPMDDSMGAYTINVEGQRKQFSGPLVMRWKMALVLF